MALCPAGKDGGRGEWRVGVQLTNNNRAFNHKCLYWQAAQYIRCISPSGLYSCKTATLQGGPAVASTPLNKSQGDQLRLT